jgi:ketose-bisphosphate aldolase
MPIVSAKEILIEATRGRYAVGAFNCTSIIQMEAAVQAAEENHAPIILQTSVAPAKFFGPRVLAAVYRELAESAKIPVVLHLDHCTDTAFCKVCADSGYTNIMIDGSKQEWEGNIRVTREVADYCHRGTSISVEGELGTVSGVEDQVKVSEDETQLADPEKSAEFVEKTGIDLFAPAIGTAHGVYKTADPKIDIDRFAKIAQILNGKKPRVPLVVHGGTGLPNETVLKLIEAGAAKVNVSTELKYVLIDSSWDYLQASRGDYNPGNLDKAVHASTKTVVSKWLRLLGSAGKM